MTQDQENLKIDELLYLCFEQLESHLKSGLLTPEQEEAAKSMMKEISEEIGI